MTTIERRARDVIADELGIGIDEAQLIASDARLAEDLGADSSDRLSLTLALEEEFQIAISDHDAQQLTTVRQIVDYLQRHDDTAA